MTTRKAQPPKLEPTPVIPEHHAIRVLYGYRGGRTNEIYIPAGEYGLHSFALMGFDAGLAGYLVENGHAIWVDGK